MMNSSIVKLLLFLPIFIASAQDQHSTLPTHREIFRITSPADTATIALSKGFIIANSIRVESDSFAIRSYHYHSVHNTLVLRFDAVSSAVRVVVVTYSFLPISLKKTYSLRSLIFKADSLDGSKKQGVVTQSEGIFTNMFGPELSKSGSITRGFIVGSNRDLTLSSGFRLQMAGKLSDDIEVLAALTDENTPIQPQGNTQSLQEVDNVFVEMRHPVYTATLGDFLFNNSSGEFVRVNRKLQGANIVADYRSIDPQTRVQVTGATNRGKFHSQSFQGIEGVQGPYRLTGKNNERAIIVIAGSERVFVDGAAMTRGDNNDYTIDYASAEVIFASRRLITSASRIVVDFEYSDRQYTRNFIGLSSSTILSDDVNLKLHYFREGDDPDAPIDVTLSDADKILLQQSGNTQASKSGAFYVGFDSLGIGKGSYTAVDTIINGSPYRIYRYEQNTPLALYSVAFSAVGPGKGEYLRESVGRYRFVGLRAGHYSPVILLPTPQLHQQYSIQSDVTPFSDFSLSTEYSASSFDQNRFSSIGDPGNSGGAISLTAQYQPKNIIVDNTSLGSISVLFHERYKQKQFLALDRTDIVEFGRKWSTDSLSSAAAADEEIREGNIHYQPSEHLSFMAGAGLMERTGQFKSNRYEGSFAIADSAYPVISYRYENISGKDLLLLRSNEWLRQKGDASYSFSLATPSLRYEAEHRKVVSDETDSLLSSSYAFYSLAPKLAIVDYRGIDVSTEYEWRKDRLALNGMLIPEASSFTQNYTFALREVKNFSASSGFIFREKSYEKEFQSVNLHQQSTLIKIQSRYRPLSQGLDITLFYDAASQRTAQLERVFYKVRKGEGQYRWVDANGNGITDLNDEQEFIADRYDGEYVTILLNSDNLVPVMNLKTSSRIRISPARMISHPESNAEKIAVLFSTETYIRIEERSTEPDAGKIYLLNLSSFLNPRTTLLGSQFLQQDLHLFELHPEYSFRLRFNQRHGLSQFATGIERNYSRERSIRSRLLFSDEVSNQTDIAWTDDNAVSSSAINQSRKIAGISLRTDFSYRLERTTEFGLVLETSQTDDHAASTPISANFNGQTVRFVYGFLGNGQIRSEFSREEVLIGMQPAGYTVPYELTAGRDFGKNFLWSISSEYRMGGNVQFSLQYSGRTTSRASIVHNGRMEVRAYF